MSELTFSQNFAIIALNALDSHYMTVAKKVSVRCIAAAVLLELYLERDCSLQSGVVTLPDAVASHEPFTLYQETVLETLRGSDRPDGSRAYELLEVTHLSTGSLKKIERAITDSLKGTDTLDEVPSLLGCDLDYDSAGITLNEYRAAEEPYARLTEGLRAEILEDGEMNEETILMLWLLRESGSLYDLFSKEELQRVALHMSGLFERNPLAKQVLKLVIHRSLETTAKNFLRFKRDVARTPIATGVNFAFPVFQRSQAIFVEMEAAFSKKEDRLRDLERRLTEKGHRYTVLRAGEVPLLQIDNCLYEAVPATRTVKFPIQGIRLRRYPLY